MNVLVIGDTHCPATHPGYLSFCRDLHSKYKCNKVLHIGDVADFHSVSRHEASPEADGPVSEFEAAQNQILQWNKAFPKAQVCEGNHDKRVYTQAATVNIPGRFLKGYNELWQIAGWDWKPDHIIDDVYYFHGTGCGGTYPAPNTMQKMLMSTVMGHIHSAGGIWWRANPQRRIFGMNVGCVSADTEYMSPTGWVRIDRYLGGPVMQVSTQGVGEWVLPSRYVVKPCEEFNAISHGYGLSQVWCDEHRVLYKSRAHSAGCLEATGAEIVNRHNSAKTNLQCRIPVTCSSAGGAGIGLSPEQIRIQIAFHADGTLLPNGRGAITVKKARKINRVRALLASSGMKYTEVTYSNKCVRFRFVPPRYTKSYGPEWYACTPEQLQVVTDEVLFWDGNQKAVYDSRHKCDCDFVQYAFAGTGRRCSIVPGHRTFRTIVSRTRDTVSFGTGKFVRQPSVDGLKYCFTVPSGALLLRHNSCVYVTGNCGCDDKHIAFKYGENLKVRSILSAGVVLDGVPQHIIMPMAKGEKYHRSRFKKH
jgi:predicted phosphodiesterase